MRFRGSTSAVDRGMALPTRSKRASTIAVTLTVGMLVANGLADAAEPVGPKLTPRLNDLLTQEMQQINEASAQVFQAIVAGDHATVAELGRRIHDSFIIKQALTVQDKADLKAAVPPEFLALDGEFHAAAAELAEAADAQDVAEELTLFAKMTETCVTCHGTYASDRFPTLVRE